MTTRFEICDQDSDLFLRFLTRGLLTVHDEGPMVVAQQAEVTLSRLLQKASALEVLCRSTLQRFPSSIPR